MPTVTNTFDRHAVSATNVATNVISAPVGSGVVMTVMGLVVTNTFNTDIFIDVMLTTSIPSSFYLLKGSKVPVGEAMIVVGWDQKLVLKEGDNITVNTGTATHTADVVMSVLKITTA